jgi:hypothetical protein
MNPENGSKYVKFTVEPRSATNIVGIACGACGFITTLLMGVWFFYEIIRKDPVNGTIGLCIGLFIAACIFVPMFWWIFKRDREIEEKYLNRK